VTAGAYAIALGTVAVGALTQGALGFGFGMLVAPVLAIIDQQLVPGAVLVLGVTVAAVVAWQERGALDWRGIKWALVGRMLGTFAGVAAVSRLDHEQLTVVLGVFILLAVVLSVAGWHVRPTPSTLVGAGTMSGVMGTLTSIGGPPMALVYQREQAAKLRSTLAGFFLFGASLAIVSLAISGEFGGRQLTDGLLLLPGLVLGIVASRFLGPYLDRGWARPAVLALCTIAAVVLIADAVT
jgi:uncharacterized membrane protein YfcA